MILYKLTGENLEQKIEELSNKDFQQAIREKEDSEKVKPTPKNNNSDDNLIEVDLHINALIDSVTGLSNADILEFQLNKFHEVLRQNQYEKGKKIVFIHGVGEGVLKTELEYLFKNYHVTWYEASFQKYGLGATEVYVYQNTKD